MCVGTWWEVLHAQTDRPAQLIKHYISQRKRQVIIWSTASCLGSWLVLLAELWAQQQLKIFVMLRPDTAFWTGSKSNLTLFFQRYARSEAHAPQGGKKSLASYHHGDPLNCTGIMRTGMPNESCASVLDNDKSVLYWWNIVIMSSVPDAEIHKVPVG